MKFGNLSVLTEEHVASFYYSVLVHCVGFKGHTYSLNLCGYAGNSYMD